MDRITASLNDCSIEYIKEGAEVEIEEDAGPAGSWFPGSYVGGAGKMLNIGDCNKEEFHKKFTDTKTPLMVHVLCCHTQYDCNAASCLDTRAAIPVKETDKIKWKDGSTVIGITKDIPKLFPTSLKDGTNSFKSGSWADASPGVAASVGANLAAGDVWIEPNKISIKLPAAAELVVKADPANLVNLEFTVFIPKGPYLGESDGTKGYLQLIVINMDKTSVNDVMAHELGHTLNQVVKSAPPGLTLADHGRKYTGNGHQGPHCADGMSDDNYNGGAGKVGSAYAGDFKGAPECKCILYGENSSKGSKSTGKFCDRCKPFLSAEALTTLH
jgi:hypothetical protein